MHTGSKLRFFRVYATVLVAAALALLLIAGLSQSRLDSDAIAHPVLSPDVQIVTMQQEIDALRAEIDSLKKELEQK